MSPAYHHSGEGVNTNLAASEKSRLGDTPGMVDDNPLRRLRLAQKLSYARLGVRARTTGQQVERLEKGTRKLTKEWAERLGAALQVSPESLLFGDRESPDDPPADDLLVYGTVEGGPGALVVSQGVIDTFPRPTRLADVPDAYALYVVGDSMAPVYRAGDLIVIHPHLPPRRDDGAVFYSTEPGRAQIKEFVAATQTEWKVRRYQPKEAEFTLSKKEWPRCHLVYARFSRR